MFKYDSTGNKIFGVAREGQNKEPNQRVISKKDTNGLLLEEIAYVEQKKIWEKKYYYIFYKDGEK